MINRFADRGKDPSDEEMDDGSDTERRVRGTKRGSGSGASKSSDEYKRRRERNNVAVKKSRNKSKQKAQDTVQRVTYLQQENANLENKIKLLTKELNFLKDLFLSHAGGTQAAEQLDLDTLFVASSDDRGATGTTANVADEESRDVAATADHEYTLQVDVKVEV